MNRLKGRTALITASSYGIGYSIAERLGLEGARVVICSRKRDNVEAAIDKLKSVGLKEVSGVVCHVADGDQRKELLKEVSKYGALDILVSNAAVNPSKTPILQAEESQWDKIFEVNVKSSFMLAKEVAPHLKNNTGRIIFISSVVAYSPHGIAPHIGSYSVSKTALLGLSKSIAAQLAPKQITVNCVSPGAIRTQFLDGFMEAEIMSQEDLESLIPMKRLGLPHEISGVVAFLASDDASYITGENILVSGGLSSRI